MKAGKQCPIDFLITEDMRIWAEAKVPGVDIDDETEMFCDHEFAHSHKNWVATWRNWMRREQKTINKTQSNRDFYAGKIQKPVTQEQSMKEIESLREMMELPLTMSAEDVLACNEIRKDRLPH